MRLTLVNGQTGRTAAITYPAEKSEILDALDQCQLPYGSGEYTHLPVSPYRVEPDSLQVELARMIDDLGHPPSIHELNYLGEKIQEMSREGRTAYERELQRYPGVDIVSAINMAHSILLQDQVYDGISMAGRAVLLDEQEPLLRVQLTPEGIGAPDDPSCGVWLDCPVSEAKQAEVAQSMGMDSPDELEVNMIDGMALLGDTCLWEAQECFTRFSDVDRIASALQTQGGIAQAAKFKAALLLESCSEFYAAADIAGQLHEYEFYRSAEFLDKLQQTRPNADAEVMADELGFEETDYGYVRKAGEQALEQQLHVEGPEFQPFSMQ